MRERADGTRPGPLAGAAVGAGALAALIGAGLAIGAPPFGWDRAMIVGLRAPGVPAWLAAAAIDVTALGSVTVLSLWVVAATVLLAAQRRWRVAAATLAACASVSPAIDLAKWAVARPRPTLVPHLVAAGHSSFPSGHAAGSAAGYLTLAALGASAMADRRAGRALLAMAAALVALIGASRVYLGVHWPSDVLAGWCFGAAWALAWRWGTAGARAA